MGDLSPNFSSAEFCCKCGCGYCKINNALLFALEAIREHFGQPITITSGCRCETHNANVGGKPGSRHLHGEAADMKVKWISPAEVAAYAANLIGDRGGVGRYSNFTHIDVRGHRARWSGNK